MVCTVKKNNAIGYPLVIAISLIIIKKILLMKSDIKKILFPTEHQ